MHLGACLDARALCAALSLVAGAGLAAAGERRVEVRVNPAEVMLGEGPSSAVVVGITVFDDSGALAKDADILLDATAGALEGLHELGAGRFEARLLRPPETFPRLAVVTAADLAGVALGEAPVVGTAVVAYSARILLNGRTEPRARMEVRLGQRRYGPVQADGAGQFSVPIEVHPGEGFAQGVAKDELGNASRSRINLFLPEVQRLHGFVFPGELVADGEDSGWIYITTLSPAGALEDAAITLTTERGRAGVPARLGRGVYCATYAAPSGAGAGHDAVTLTHVKRHSSVSLSIALSAAAPMRGTLAARPELIPADGRSLGLAEVSVVDRAGNPSSGHRVQLSLAGVQMAAEEIRPGTYQATLPPRQRVGIEPLIARVEPVSLSCRRARLLRGTAGWHVVDRTGVGCAGKFQVIQPGGRVEGSGVLGAAGLLPEASKWLARFEAGARLEVAGAVPRRIAIRAEGLPGRGVELAEPFVVERAVQWRPAAAVELSLQEVGRTASAVRVRVEARGLDDLASRVRLRSGNAELPLRPVGPLAAEAEVSRSGRPVDLVAVDLETGVAAWLRLD
jgi:hypothetical protein